MIGRRLPSGRDIRYFKDWCRGWRQIARKRIDKKLARREDRHYLEKLMTEEIKYANASNP